MSRGINKVILIGNVGQNPTHYPTDSGGVSSLSLATTKQWKKDGIQQTKTEWHNLVGYGKLSEIINQYVKKGDKIYIEGELQTTTYLKDNVEMRRVQVVINQLQMLGGVKHPDENRAPNGNVAPTAQENDFNYLDDDIPF